jgi:hypothetical protein
MTKIPNFQYIKLTKLQNNKVANNNTYSDTFKNNFPQTYRRLNNVIYTIFLFLFICNILHFKQRIIYYFKYYMANIMPCSIIVHLHLNRLTIIKINLSPIVNIRQKNGVGINPRPNPQRSHLHQIMV